MMDVEKTDRCECTVVHQENVDKAKEAMPSIHKLTSLAGFFDAFSDLSRLKMVYALLQNELCVCDLSVVTGMSQSAVSHQLKILKQGHIVKFRREGKSVFYSLDDTHVIEILKLSFEHLMH